MGKAKKENLEKIRELEETFGKDFRDLEIPCACGCRMTLKRFIFYGKSLVPVERTMIHGHNRKGLTFVEKPEQEIIFCVCGCGKTLEKYKFGNGYFYERKYILGHNPPTENAYRPKGKDTYNWKGGPPKCEICGKILGHGNHDGGFFCREHSKNIARGKNHYNWKNGITSKNEKIRKSRKYAIWRISVFERDDFVCQNCEERGGVLHAHHIKSFSEFPELRFVISNGVTLCERCHKLTHGWSISE
jgi:5-methylcytosine-specific restriction endonuclease McrA